MSKITKSRFEEIEEKSNEFLQKVRDDIEDRKFIKTHQLTKYLIKAVFGHSIDEKSSTKCVNRQSLADITFCVHVYLRSVKLSLDKKITISSEQIEEELVGVIKGYKEFFGALAAEIRAYSAFKACEVDEYEAMDLARLLTRQCEWAFSYQDNRIMCTLSDFQMREWILMHIEMQ